MYNYRLLPPEKDINSKSVRIRRRGVLSELESCIRYFLGSCNGDKKRSSGKMSESRLGWVD